MTLNLQHPKISGETTVHNAIAEVAAIMGENVRLRRGYVMPAPSQGLISTYLHTSPQPGSQLSPIFIFVPTNVAHWHIEATSSFAHTQR